MSRVLPVVVVAAPCVLPSCDLLVARPDLSAYEVLRAPRITARADDRVLQAVMTGDPRTTADKALGALVAAWFALPGVDKGRFVPPKVRWNAPAGAPLAEATSTFAIPVSDGMTAVPKTKDGEVQVTLATWSYGTVAEILHAGAYDQEEATRDTLRAFIAAQGYVVIGEPEEEYLIGPGSPGDDGPQSWRTILRYRVAKASPKQAPPARVPTDTQGPALTGG